MVPGDRRPVYEQGSQARQILNDAEDDLRDWRPEADLYGTPESGSPIIGSNKGNNRAIDEADETHTIPTATSNGGPTEHTMTGAMSASEAYRDEESSNAI